MIASDNGALPMRNSTVHAKRPETLETRLSPRPWKPESAQPRRPCDRFRPPSGVHLEIPHCRRNRGVAAVVENQQPSGAHELAQVEQVDKDVVEDMAAVHEGGIGGEALA